MPRKPRTLARRLRPVCDPGTRLWSPGSWAPARRRSSAGPAARSASRARSRAPRSRSASSTAAGWASAACVLTPDGEFEVVPEVAELSAPPAHARDLLPRVAEAMERAGVGFGDLDAVAVGTGPGTFTGLRVGIATARGLAHA